ncbi:MAG: baseplate J/gp47 family protein [Pseudomonadota bacterium]
MTTTQRFNQVDLSQLPLPAVVEDLAHTVLLDRILQRFAEVWPEFEYAGTDDGATLIPGDPAVKVHDVTAYVELLLRQRINDAARALYRSTAVGTDLENLAANYLIRRVQLTEATNDTAAVFQSDAVVRERMGLAWEGMAAAGPRGAYHHHARLAAPDLKDVNAYKPFPDDDGRRDHIDVVLLGPAGNGVVDADTVSAVRTHLHFEDVKPLTDVVHVRSATIHTYAVSVVLKVPGGPDPNVVKAEAEKAVAAYVASVHRIGATAYRQAIGAAATVGNVLTAEVSSPAADIDPGPDGAPYCTGITVEIEVI